ncbi:RNA methyltransferase [Prochlorococcus marinus]|uniref:tRNA (cytidine/uridine-2'-O-)-methyltransferase TrmJ n=1 Tax=Prochlorococcus marinus XMU1408 TaxID=2213228 RepID=A0A318QXY6_PROMR|nr:RNA methyltransferase [Prochlorococcus marinus]MBW3042303.1 rRNA methyltransferase [Prochlorococcus marinus str. XMU1408]PYE01689.1 rRNA methyltransferase [Prochlorococcus marinus XMU1408]
MIIKKTVKVILVEPAGTINIGSVARLCENFNVNELRLVSPKCDYLALEAKKMAVKGLKKLEEAKIYNDLNSALSDCSRVIATCGRKEHGEIPLNSNKDALYWAIESEREETIALVFGREDRGLTNEELLKANKVISLNTSKNYPSLNLSHAVAIVLHQFNLLNEFDLLKPNKIINYPSNLIKLEDCINDAGSLFLDIGFLMKHTYKAKMAKIKKLLLRAEVNDDEVALIRGIISQARWAIKNKNH